MYKVMAVIEPAQLEPVRKHLVAIGVCGMTICDCAGHGRSPRMVPGLRGGPDVAYLDDHVQIEVAVSEAARDKVIAAIAKGARFTQTSGGKIFVVALERAISIRTGLDDDLSLEAPALIPAGPWVEAAE